MDPTQQTTTFPETYFLARTAHVPNSSLPVLLYRSVLPLPYHQQSARRVLEANDWIQGGVFSHYPSHHYHSVTHECYAVFQGSSRFLLGKGPLDETESGVEVRLNAGDIIVQPVSPYVQLARLIVKFGPASGRLSYLKRGDPLYILLLLLSVGAYCM